MVRKAPTRTVRRNLPPEFKEWPVEDAYWKQMILDVARARYGKQVLPDELEARLLSQMERLKEGEGPSVIVDMVDYYVWEQEGSK